jgi:hypothetical protein
MVLLLVGTLGCGTRRYEERLRQTVERLGKESAFAGMYPPVEVPGSPVTIQLPQLFQESPLPEDTDPRRLQPPSIELPDLKFTYEGFFPYPDGSKIAIYCYVAAPAMVASKSRTPADRLRGELQAAISGWTGKWESVQCKTPTGLGVEWQHLEGTTKQQFYFVDAEGNQEYRETDAILKFYSRREGDVMLIIGWRVPADIAQLIGPEGDRGLAKWAPRVPGSVTVKQ